MEEGGLVLNKGLRAIQRGLKEPWEVLPPGQRVEPLVRDDDADSQAPTRQASRESTPAPPWVAPSRQTTPAPAPRPGSRRPTPAIPETVPEEPAIPETVPEEPAVRKGKRKRRAPPVGARDDAETELVAEAPVDPRPPPAPRRGSDPAQSLVRRARAARARRALPADRITPANYDAVDVQARFGLIERPDLPQPWPGQTLLVAHTPPKRDPVGLLALRPGDTLRVLSTRAGAEGWAPLLVQFVTRSHYFAPGRQVTSVVLGVRTDEWAHALRGQPPR